MQTAVYQTIEHTEIRKGDNIRYTGPNAFAGLTGTVRKVYEGESGDYAGPMARVELGAGRRAVSRNVRLSWLERIESSS